MRRKLGETADAYKGIVEVAGWKCAEKV